MASEPGTDWRAGLAQVEITPEHPTRMGGYGARTALSEGVHDPLTAKALALANFGGAPAVLITMDLIGVDADYATAVTAVIAAKTGVPRERVIINSSHTHGGPIFGIRYPSVYGLVGAELAASKAYSEGLEAKLVRLVHHALADLQPARLAWDIGSGSVSFAMNRRKFTAVGVENAPNPRGYVDRTVPVLRVAAADGSLRGVVFGYSCHNTTLGATNLLFTSDYAGYAQRFVEAHCHGAQAMFVQGFGADANPYPRGTFELACRHGEALGEEVVRVLTQAELRDVEGTLQIAFDHVDLPLEPAPNAAELAALRRRGSYYRGVADRIQALLDSGKPWASCYGTPVALWQVGAELTFVRLSGEVVGDYVRLLEEALGPLGLWPLGYGADYHGYLPSSRVHAEGGYEARDFITGYGYLSTEVEAAVLAKVRDLAVRVGRLPART